MRFVKLGLVAVLAIGAAGAAFSQLGNTISVVVRGLRNNEATRAVSQLCRDLPKDGQEFMELLRRSPTRRRPAPSATCRLASMRWRTLVKKRDEVEDWHVGQP